MEVTLSKLTDWLFGTSPTLETRSEVLPGIEPPPRVVWERTVTTGDAFSLSTVYRAISIHAVSAKQLSIKVYRGDEEVESPLWVRHPDVNISRSAFLEQTVVSLASNGNAFWLVTRDNQNRVTNLETLNPQDVVIDTDHSGRTTKYQHGGKYYRTDEIKHLALLRVPGNPRGLGPIQAAQVELRGALDLRDFSNNWFQDSTQPTGILKSDQVLSPDQARAAKEAWNATAGAKRGVAVLGNGLNYTPAYLSPEDAQWISNQKFTVSQIARLLGIPANMLLAEIEGTSMTYANVEQEWIAYIRFGLTGYLVEIEDALSSLLPGRQEAKFNIEALLRSDTLSRYTAHQIALQNKWLTVAEVRQIENLAPLTKKQEKELGIGQPAPILAPIEKEVPEDGQEAKPETV